MPQFPFEPIRRHQLDPKPTPKAKAKAAPKQLDKGAEARNVNVQAEERVVPESKAKPKTADDFKFKTTESIGPVARVKLDPSQRPKTKSSRKSPFRDQGLFDDTDSLVQIRDRLGKPVVFSLLAISLVGLIYWFSRPADNESARKSQLLPMMTQSEELLQSEVPSKAILAERTELADQLMTFKESDEAQHRGAELKLRSLTNWDVRNIESSVRDDEIRDQIQKASRSFINSRNKKVSNLARVGLMLARVHKYVDSPNEKFFPELLDQYKLVSNFARDDLPTAQNLFKIASSFESRELKDESAQLFRAISLACSTSQKEEITALAADAKERVTGTSGLLDELKALLADDKKVEIETVREKISSSLSEGSISVSSMEAALDFLDLLVQKNAAKVTAQLMPDIGAAVYLLPPGIERDAIKQRFDDAQKRVGLIDKVFEFDGLYTLEGRPISRSSFEKQPKFVVFWSPDNRNSIELLKRISDKAKEFIQRKVKIIAIASIDDTRTERARISSVRGDCRGIDFYALYNGRTQSQAFVSRFPVPGLPYWCLLSQFDKVQALNTSPGIIVVQDLY